MEVHPFIIYVYAVGQHQNGIFYDEHYNEYFTYLRVLLQSQLLACRQHTAIWEKYVK